MKIVVFSDSHRIKSAMLGVVETESPETIIHLGDHDKDSEVILSTYPDIPTRCVRGNCDYSSSANEIDKFVLAGKKFFITHGHLFSVKTGLSSITRAAVDDETDILLFGHTHIPYSAELDNLIIINPGSIGIGQTYAVLDIKNGTVKYELKTVPNLNKEIF